MPRIIVATAIVLAGFSGLQAAVAAPTATTVDVTVACPTEADFVRYGELAPKELLAK
jgi:hypothetical protein